MLPADDYVFSSEYKTVTAEKRLGSCSGHSLIVSRVTYICNTLWIIYHTIIRHICFICHICCIYVTISATWVLVWVSVQSSYKEARKEVGMYSYSTSVRISFNTGLFHQPKHVWEFGNAYGLNMHYLCSSAFFPKKSSTLNEAEDAMLELYAERAQLKDGQSVLDVGCGWGSLSMFLAEKYPNSKVTGVSNSETQRAFITEECR